MGRLGQEEFFLLLIFLYGRFGPGRLGVEGRGSRGGGGEDDGNPRANSKEEVIGLLNFNS